MDRIKLINPLTHTEMWVTEDRLEEYKGLGVIPVPDTVPTEEVKEKKRTTRSKK